MITEMESNHKSSQSQLTSLLKSHDALPYLFIGSGLSRRYLDLPDWRGLLSHFSELIDGNFAYLFSSANGDLPRVASLLAKEFHDHWWRDAEFSEQRELYSHLVTSKESALKVAISEYIKENQSLSAGTPGCDNSDLNREIHLLAEAVVDGIITTNYDSLSDQIFPNLTSYTGQDQLLFGDAQFVSELYKIHGSYSDPNSMIVTENDYIEFRKKNKYLAAKLLTIFTEHPVIFVGYSLTDEYIREILNDISLAVGPARMDELGNRLIFVEWRRDPDSLPSIERSTFSNESGVLPITRIETFSFDWIWSSLGDLERKIPLSLLRNLKKHVYNLVSRPNPDQDIETVQAIPFDSEEDNGVKVVMGIGMYSDQEIEEMKSLSARLLHFDDVVADVLDTGTRPIDTNNALEVGIPESLHLPMDAYVPVYKYLRESGRISADGTIDFSELPTKIESYANKDIYVTEQSEKRYARDIEGRLSTPSDIASSELAPNFKLDCLILLNPNNYDIDELRDFLVTFGNSSARTKGTETAYRKVLAHYDRLKFGVSQ
jgi:hypothetical protein